MTVNQATYVYAGSNPARRTLKEKLEWSQLWYSSCMQVKKSVQLTTKSLEELLQKGESFDFRLDQEAWQDLQVGDYIEFWEDFTGWQTEPTGDARKVIVKIEHIYKAPTFKELFNKIGKEFTDKHLSWFRNWWSEEKEINEGVLAFHVVVKE